MKVPDCLIGLSYALQGDRQPTPMTRAVLDKIYTLYKQFPHSRVIVSTGDNQHLNVSNARIMKHYLTQKGIPERQIIEEDKSSNTFQNITESVKIIRQLNLSRPLLVTYDLHTRRAIAAAKKAGLICSSVSATTNKVTMGKRKIWQLNRFTMHLYEITALTFSRLAGWA